MKFNNLEEFVKAEYTSKAIWLRLAKEKDVAIVMAQEPEFAAAVNETVSEKGRKALAKTRKGDYNKSLQRLLSIEFEPIS
jgi:hypothetical protein